MKTKILIGIISLILFFVGFYFYQNLQYYLLSFIPEVEIQYRKLSTQIFQPIYFGLTISIIPFLSYILWHKFKIEKSKNRFYIILAFIISSIIALILRTRLLIFITQIPFTKTVILESDNKIKYGKPFYEIENLHYILYIFIAEIITFIILYLILNLKKRKIEKS
ncbi:hypothetical protein [Cloacibacterium sp.]|uniref:hypothetical protein n=1 Tax=Cloacibacterium sp. TaxID=1913682 RepID=UPI0039E40D9B